jgi:phosphoadenosine phosphosulfate reductase
LNTAKILEETIRAAFAAVAEAPIEPAVSNEPANSSDASFDRDLAYRVAAVRRIVSGRVVFTTSFDFEDQAITHAIFNQQLAIDVVTLDTGRLFPETYRLWEQTERRYGRRITAVYPDRDGVESLVAHQGINGFYASIEARHACCAVRRAEPLRRALAGAVAWITGLRADQPDERVGASFAVVAPHHRLIKVNPLFDWTREQVIAFIREHDIPYNALHEYGFAAIGCAPCTRAVATGEPARAGLWSWEQERNEEHGPHDCHCPQAPASTPFPSSQQETMP